MLVCLDVWEVIQLHAGAIEEQMLRQVLVLYTGMLLPVWISQVSYFLYAKVEHPPCVYNCVLFKRFW